VRFSSRKRDASFKKNQSIEQIAAGNSGGFDYGHFPLALLLEAGIVRVSMCVSRSIILNIVAPSKRWCGDIAMSHGNLRAAEADSRD
jgi:hypothetical protein